MMYFVFPETSSISFNSGDFRSQIREDGKRTKPQETSSDCIRSYCPARVPVDVKEMSKLILLKEGGR